ncbi:MAG: amidohydrolase [Pseudomonadota bacterium]
MKESPASELRVTLVQSDLQWHDPQANKAMYAEKIAALVGETDLIVLPEMFTSGFTTEIDGLDAIGAPTTEWMLQQAKLSGAAITGSTVFEVDAGHVNRMLFVTPCGEVQHYDKTHLFRMAGEHKRYVAGDARVVVAYHGWKILLTVCYDLRFPVFCRNKQDYDLLLCVANWPAARRTPWRTLLQARAIENLAYSIGVNRIGLDGKGLEYSGDSMLVDFKGDALIDHPRDTEFTETHTISLAKLANFRDKFQAWRDADRFELQL